MSVGRSKNLGRQVVIRGLLKEKFLVIFLQESRRAIVPTALPVPTVLLWRRRRRQWGKYISKVSQRKDDHKSYWILSLDIAVSVEIRSSCKLHSFLQLGEFETLAIAPINCGALSGRHRSTGIPWSRLGWQQGRGARRTGARVRSLRRN